MNEANMQSVMATVIMAAYNTEEYIEEAIDSILQQSYKNFELLIVEDASTDGTLDVIKKYTDSRIRLIKNAENLGQTKCLNIGIREASGKYILIMDSDDIALPDRLKIQIEFMEQNPEIVAAGSWLKGFGKKNYVLQTPPEHDEIRALLVLGNVVANTTFIIRKSILDTYDVQYNESIRYAQDYYFIEEMSTRGKIAVIPQVLMKYRTHDKQVSIAKEKEQITCLETTFKRILADLGIALSDREMELWSKLCIGEFKDADDNEKQIVTDIVKCIKKNNEELRLYNQEILVRILEDRLAFPNMRIQNKAVDEKFLLQIDLLDKWLKKKIEGQSLRDYFVKRNYKTIAIYGMAVLGKRLVDELENTDIKVKYFMDNNKGAYYKELERKDASYRIEDVDVVVITPVHCFDEICRELNISKRVSTISMQDIIYDI